MGHLHNLKGLYGELQERANKTQSGLAATPEVYQILKLLFTEEEAAIAVKMPLIPRRISTIERRTGIPRDELEKKLDVMAQKGLVFDFIHPKRGSYYMLAPPVVGFFEMSMMRVRHDIDQKEVAHWLSLYMYDRPDFVAEFARGGTPIGRALVYEDALSPTIAADVLDYERATALIEDADQVGIGLCYCRHKQSHLDAACDAPQDVCMTLNRGADFAIRRGHAREADKSELLEKLADSRERGLVQIADNVQNQPISICNCCGCCCGQLIAINRHGVEQAVATSNYIATIDTFECKGCGKCTKACPVQAISLRPHAPYMKGRAKAKRHAEVDESICLGCGVCFASCKHEALTMGRRDKRVLTPANTMERVISMSMGRGHLHDLLFDEHDGPKAAFLNRLVGALEQMPLTRRLAVNETLKSRFVSYMARKPPKKTRAAAEIAK